MQIACHSTCLSPWKESRRNLEGWAVFEMIFFLEISIYPNMRSNNHFASLRLNLFATKYVVGYHLNVKFIQTKYRGFRKKSC